MIAPVVPLKFEGTEALISYLMTCQWVPFANYVARVDPVDVSKLLNEEEQ